MTTFEKIFREFLILNDSRLNFRKKEFKDVYLEGNYLLRQFKDTYTIYFLTSSDTITIPTSYIDLFTKFNTEYSGLISEILAGGNEKDPQEKNINKLIRYLLQLSRDIQSNVLFYRKDSILSCIEKIVDLGILSKFRDLVKELTGLILDPWKIENLNQSISI